MAVIGYLGNRNLKGGLVQISWTKEMLEEYAKCAKDPIYFIENHMKIVNLNKGLQLFDPYAYQKDMITTMHENRFSIFMTPRQAGKSTVVVGYFLWCLLFIDMYSIGILANKGKLARDLLNKIRFAYEYIPKYLQQGVKTWNKGELEFENGSKIIAAATSSSGVRGGTYNAILMDEFAHISDGVTEEFFSSVYPTISSGLESKIIIVSTPKGINMFHKMWSGAVAGANEYVPYRVRWQDVPGRDEKWKEETIKNTSERQFAEEFECLFESTSTSLIEYATLKAMLEKVKIPKFSPDKALSIYKDPEKGHAYVMCIDVARGVGNDSSTFLTIDVTNTPYEVVSLYRNNRITPLLFPEIIHKVARHYNDADLFIEINDIGGQIADILWHEFEYENIIFTTTSGTRQKISGGFGGSAKMGVRTTTPVKNIGCSVLKTLVENNQWSIYDIDVISELVQFNRKGKSYAAAPGYHDDLVMPLVLFSWLSTQPYFKEMHESIDIRQRLKEINLSQIEDSLTPFGFIDDGRDDDNGYDNSMFAKPAAVLSKNYGNYDIGMF